jgi:hypothetical protein
MGKGSLCNAWTEFASLPALQMERYVYKRRQDGIFVINLEKTWEKLQLAARVIVAIENPQDVIVQSARPYGQRAVFKFAQYLNCKYSAGRHTPGTFTNQVGASTVTPAAVGSAMKEFAHHIASNVRGLGHCDLPFADPEELRGAPPADPHRPKVEYGTSEWDRAMVQQGGHEQVLESA